MKKYYVLIGLVAFVVYFQVLFFGFTYLDDNTLLLDNAAVYGNVDNAFRVFTTDFMAPVSGGFYYRPLLALSLIFNAKIAGTSAFLYHLTDVLLHVVAVLLVFKFFQTLGYKIKSALVASLIFAVHPALTQTVAWIPARNDTLATIFALAAFIAFHEFLTKKHWKYLAWHLVAFFLALLSKENTVLLPILCVFYAVFMLGQRRLSWSQFAITGGWFTLTLAWYLLRSHTIAGAHFYTLGQSLKSMFENINGLLIGIGKMILPVNLSNYPVPQDASLLFGTIAVLILAGFVALSRPKRWSYLLFGLGWLLLFFLPGLVRPESAKVELLEHRIYLPIIGIFILLLETNFMRKFDIARKIYTVPAGAVIIAFAVLNITHAHSFRDGFSYWEQATRTSPHSAFARNQMGAMAYLGKDLDRAAAEYTKAIELNPDEPLVHNNLGLVYAEQDKLAEAENEYKKELEVNPNYNKTHFNLGFLYARQKRFVEAESEWQATLKANPFHFDAHLNLLAYYYENRDYAKALAQLTAYAAAGGPVNSTLQQIYQELSTKAAKQPGN